MEKEKTLMRILLVTFGIVAISFVLYGTMVIINGNTIEGIAIIASAIVILIIGILVVNNKVKRLNSGQPITDELSTAQTFRAGYFSFASSFIIWSFMIPLVDEFAEPRFVIYLGMLLTVLVFFIALVFMKNMDI